MIYKIVQNNETPFQYEYAHDYTSISECINTISEYEQDDAHRGEYHEYAIIDMATGDTVNIDNMYKGYAIACMVDIGLPVDEALITLE